MIEFIQEWSVSLPWLVIPIVVGLAFLLYRATRFLLGRISYAIALRTETIYDDLFVDRLQPFRFAWLLPLMFLYFSVDSLFPNYVFLKRFSLVLSIWFLTDFLIAVLSGINDVYKNNPRYTGVSAAGYIGLMQVLTVVAGIILTISYLSEIDLVTLLSGVGAWLAVLLLIFRDTILSFLASVQISTQKLIKEGDTVDIPTFGASGTVTDIDLQTITVQNFDNTVTTVPTSKIVETGFKNYRIMLESGARRLKRSILLDVNSIKFLDSATRKMLSDMEFINDHIGDYLLDFDSHTTNLQLFIHYTQNYIKTKKEIRMQRYPFLVRTLEHSPKGLPLEIYLFAKTSSWEKFEELQTEILIHLFAVMPHFGLMSFQED